MYLIEFSQRAGLFEILETNTTIASLLLGTNGIGDRGAKSIARLIELNNRSLLIDVLKKNYTLTHLSISGKMHPELTEILARNRANAHCPPSARNASISAIRSVYR